MILSFLRANWGVCALLVVIATLLVRNAVIETRLDRTRAELNAAKAEGYLKDSLIEQQNAAVDSLVVQREADREAYRMGISAANQRAIKIEVDAQRILDIPAPATREEQCSAAEALLREELTQ